MTSFKCTKNNNSLENKNFNGEGVRPENCDGLSALCQGLRKDSEGLQSLLHHNNIQK